MQNITPEIAQNIFSNAKTNGVPVEVYLQNVISNSQGKIETEPLLSDLLKNLVGKIDSSKTPIKKSGTTAFGQALAKKFAEQGIKLP
jgi:predicted nicotinamide N-methyase